VEELFRLMAKSGSVRGPYSEPLLPALGKTLREEQWPLPLAVRALQLRELAVLERRTLDDRDKRRSTIRSLFPVSYILHWVGIFIAGLRELVQS